MDEAKKETRGGAGRGQGRTPGAKNKPKTEPKPPKPKKCYISPYITLEVKQWLEREGKKIGKDASFMAAQLLEQKKETMKHTYWDLYIPFWSCYFYDDIFTMRCEVKAVDNKLYTGRHAFSSVEIDDPRLVGGIIGHIERVTKILERELKEILGVQRWAYELPEGVYPHESLKYLLGTLP